MLLHEGSELLGAFSLRLVLEGPKDRANWRGLLKTIRRPPWQYFFSIGHKKLEIGEWTGTWQFLLWYIDARCMRRKFWEVLIAWMLVQVCSVEKMTSPPPRQENRKRARWRFFIDNTNRTLNMVSSIVDLYLLMTYNLSN
ncbi:hypothetical protein MPTK1_1g08760 [Marchantia polymorpha subsp. ruderalis]|uniref:Uncharacterized protein n=2 Tax=Marchantia polymorpha TaxID=3197 RepID=A0AAF6AN21_MARPO|nr:hypothetical protein MARPO_0520s0001 [Marchantia polymorpha]BBM97841.1 hypothetical protein Mp_1g08760 [Marchantia polymorpha subsp. ruderalis]|eukprot:PTQ26725.1 hypothetical protein MARPO_0520s0001 [Marchantia polymorpha]